MGVYGSPDTGNLYSNKKEKKSKEEGFKPQRNLWVWAVIIIIDILFYLVSEKSMGDIITLLVLNTIIISMISVISFFINLISKRKIINDLKFLGVSIISFLILVVILSTL